MLTPAMVHYGKADSVLAGRQSVLAAAYAAHPERFVRGAPQVRPLPDAVWINPPARLNPQSADDDPGDCQNPDSEQIVNPGRLSVNQLDRPDPPPSSLEALP
jgi:hypothetical protein